MTRTVLEALAKGMAGAEHLTTEDRKAEMLEAIKAVARERERFMAEMLSFTINLHGGYFGIFTIMELPCLGPDDVIPAEPFWKIAQDYVFEDFTKYFMSNCPAGLVIQELDYLGQATSVFAKDAAKQGPLGMGSKNPYVNAILELLQDDYKGWRVRPGKGSSGGWADQKRYNFRKNDALGICPTGDLQLLEVTTVGRVLEGNMQIVEKTALLNALGKQLSFIFIDQPLKVPMPSLIARPSPWKPPRFDTVEVTRTRDQYTYICFEPTNDPARVPIRREGVILYEVHQVQLQRVPQNVPAEARQKLLDAIKRLPPNLTPEEAKKRGERHAQDNPDLVRWLQSLGENLAKAAFAIILAIVVGALVWEAAATAAALAFIVGFVTVALNRNRESRS